MPRCWVVEGERRACLQLLCLLDMGTAGAAGVESEEVGGSTGCLRRVPGGGVVMWAVSQGCKDVERVEMFQKYSQCRSLLIVLVEVEAAWFWCSAADRTLWRCPSALSLGTAAGRFTVIYWCLALSSKPPRQFSFHMVHTKWPSDKWRAFTSQNDICMFYF